MMKKKSILYLSYSLMILMFSCSTESSTGDKKLFFDINNISVIEFEDSTYSYRISDRKKLGLIVDKLNKGRVDYVKFSSNKKLTIFDNADNVLHYGFYKGKKVKFEGVTYMLEDKLF